MSVDEESYAFGKATQQVKEMLEEFNEHAPYGLEHRRQVSVDFNLTEQQMKQTAPVIFAASLEELRALTDSKNYKQYRK